jgi:hypothetical protein
MSNVKEVPAFKADWPGTVHKTYEEARQANISYLVDKLFGVNDVEDNYTREQAATNLKNVIKYDQRGFAKNMLEALVKEL